MTNTVKQSALALALLGGAALSVDPVVADTLYDKGDFAGRPKEYNHPPTFRPFYQGPAYSYCYGLVWSSYDHEFGPGIGFWGQGDAVGFRRFMEKL